MYTVDHRPAAEFCKMTASDAHAVVGDSVQQGPKGVAGRGKPQCFLEQMGEVTSLQSVDASVREEACNAVRVVLLEIIDLPNLRTQGSQPQLGGGNLCGK